MKKLTFISMLLLAACSSREILKTSSTNSQPTDKGYVYENDTVKVTYWFLAEDGIMDIKIYNKLNVPIFIDWKISNFIENDNNFKYWSDVESSTATTKGVNYYGLHTFTGLPASVHGGVTNTSTVRPDRITSITPHSDIVKAQYLIFPKKQPNVLKPFSIPAGDYTFDNSPIKFRSYLYFATNESFTHTFAADNQFYVSNATIIKQSDFKKSPPTDPTTFYSEIMQ
jgi:hypothetical protein